MSHGAFHPLGVRPDVDITDREGAKSFILILTVCASTTKNMVGTTVDSEEVTVWSRLYALMEEMKLSQNCGDDIPIDRSAILTYFRSTSSPLF